MLIRRQSESKVNSTLIILRSQYSFGTSNITCCQVPSHVRAWFHDSAGDTNFHQMSLSQSNRLFYMIVLYNHMWRVTTVSGGWYNCFWRDFAFFRVDSYIYNICDIMWKLIQQEAHGPHCSSEQQCLIIKKLESFVRFVNRLVTNSITMKNN